jgi:Retrotransposon gag protein
MKDLATDWLKSLRDNQTNSIQTLIEKFKLRHVLTRVDKWKRTADIWSRRQESTESVDDYIIFMQAATRRIGMAQTSLIDAILGGLIPELRLFVPRSGTKTIDDIRTRARISEAAHSANLTQKNKMDKLTASVETLLETTK